MVTMRTYDDRYFTFYTSTLPASIIDDLIAQMARVEPDLLQEEAREVIVRTVEDLLREVGTVDPPTPRF